jgi:uncharacterized membrane protein
LIGVPAARSPLELLVLGCHAALAVSMGVVAFGAFQAPWRELAAVLASLPLVAALPGLIARRRRALSWLALLLVAYAGAAVVEVVASAGAHRAASLASLAAVAELGLLPMLSRRWPWTTARGRTES